MPLSDVRPAYALTHPPGAGAAPRVMSVVLRLDEESGFYEFVEGTRGDALLSVEGGDAVPRVALPPGGTRATAANVAGAVILYE